MKMPIDQVHPDPSNVRKHSKKNLSAIKGSLTKFGQQKPIVVTKDFVTIAGNGTLEAAKSLGWKEIDVIVSELEGTDITAYAIADNRTGELAEWDMHSLPETLKALQEADFDLDAIGFDEKDIKALIKDIVKDLDGSESDALPETVETRCKPGDLWQLGEHRLLCGDCTDVLLIDKLMGGQSADIVYTDPPYGINENTDRKNKGWNHSDTLMEANSFHKIKGDESIDTALAAYSVCESLSKTICFWGGNYFAHKLPPSPTWIVWDKRVEENQRDMNSDCELAYVKHPTKRSVRIFRHIWKGLIKDSEQGEKRIHPTQKPVALAEWCIQELNPRAHLVVDLFLGSGSTLIACERTKRRCYGMEFEPSYCDLILSRWENATGKKASQIISP